MTKTISVIIPMYYEEKVVNECYNRMTNVMESIGLDYELLFINDGSKDNTLPLLEDIKKGDKRVRVLNFSRNFGHQIAVSAGIDNCIGDAVVIIDADLQDPPELIPDMIKLWEQGYDVVYAKRKKRDGESWFKLFTAKCFYRTLNKFTDIDIPLDTGDFRLMDRKVVNELKNMPEKNRFIRGMVSWVGFNQTAIEYERDKRFAGETKYPLKKMIKLAKDGIISFSGKPIDVMEKLGIVMFLFSISFLILGLVLKSQSVIVSYKVFFIIASMLLFLASVQILLLGIVGEYIIRIYDESKSRPLYIVDNKVQEQPSASISVVEEPNTVETEPALDNQSSLGNEQLA